MVLIRVAVERASRLRLCWGCGAGGSVEMWPPIATRCRRRWPRTRRLGVKFVAIVRKRCRSAARRPPHAAGGSAGSSNGAPGPKGESVLRRHGGWSRSLMDGLTGTQTWCGYGVFTDNATKSAAWSPPTRRPDQPDRLTGSHLSRRHRTPVQLAITPPICNYRPLNPVPSASPPRQTCREQPQTWG